MIDFVVLGFGLGVAALSLILLLWVRHEKVKLRRSVLRYERIKQAMGD